MGRFVAPARLVGFLPLLLLFSAACLHQRDCSVTDISCNEGSLAVLGELLQTQDESAAEAAGSGGGAGGSSGAGGAAGFRTVFITTTMRDGNSGGITGADAACATDNPGLSGTYRALLVDGSARVASLTANAGDGQADWVLAANTEYRHADGVTVIGVSNAAALFDFPLSEAFGSGLLWTGLDTDWTTHAHHCSGWLTTAGSGSTGNAALKTVMAVRLASTGCSAMRLLVCVQVP